jgi:hypothetical protein
MHSACRRIAESKWAEFGSLDAGGGTAAEFGPGFQTTSRAEFLPSAVDNSAKNSPRISGADGRVQGGRPSSTISRSALQQPGAATTAFGPQTGTAASFAGLLVVFATAHLFLDPTPLDQLAESANRFLDRFSVANVQLNHMSSFVTLPRGA